MNTKRFSFGKGLLTILVVVLLTFTLFACGDKDQDLLDTSIDNLAVIFGSGDNAASVTKDLNLPSTLGEATVSWSSSNTTVITNAGVVNRQFSDVSVTLTATATLNDATATKTFSLTVKGHDVNAALAAIVLAGPNITYDSSTEVYTLIGNITLPATTNGLTIEWESTIPAVLSNTGVVVRPEFGSVDANVILIATINNIEREFEISVPAITEKPVLLILQEARDQLLLAGVSDGVTTNITLPLSVGTEGVTVTWASSHPLVITTAGVVTRQEDNTTVTLTATLFLSNQTLTKEFEVVVIAVVGALVVDDIAEAISISTRGTIVDRTYVEIKDVTVIGVTTEGVVFADASGILFAYRGSNYAATDVVVGNVYNVKGVTESFFGSWQLSSQSGRPVEFFASTGAVTVVTPTVATSVTDLLSNHAIPDGIDPHLTYQYYSVTARVRIQGTDRYDTILVDEDYDGPNFNTTANTTTDKNFVVVYFPSNKAAFDAFDGEVVTVNILLYGYHSTRKIFTVLFIEKVADIEVNLSDEGSVNAEETALRATFANEYITATTLTLPTTGVFETTISWTSSHPELINAETGVLTLPAEGSTEVTLTAVIVKNDAEKEVEFKINVGETIRTVQYARDAALGTVLSIEATITSVSFDTANQAVLFVQDATAGIYIYKVPAEFKDLLVVGNTVRIRAARGVFSESTQLISTIKVSLVTPSIPVTPTVVTEPLDLFNYNGQQVSVTGYLMQTYTGTPSDYDLVTTEGRFRLRLVSSNDALDAQRTAIFNKLVGVAAGTEITVIGGATNFFANMQIILFEESQITIGALGTTEQLGAVAASRLLLPEENDEIVGDMTLPTTGLFGAVVTWTSSHPEVISAAGVVTRSTEDDILVTLTYEVKLIQQLF
jgi:hypothetical protein